MPTLVDAHCHLDFLEGWPARRRLLAALEADGIALVAQTLTPSSFLELVDAALGELDGVAPPRWSLGFHPWRIEGEAQAEAELEAFADGLRRTRFVGEVGLDFAPRRLAQAPAELQTRVLRRILEFAGEEGERRGPDEPVVVSIHAVRAVNEVVGTLAEARVAERNVVPVLHRVAPGSQELRHLVALGGCLSAHPELLERRRGREALLAMPADRLLLESDLPAEPIAVTQAEAAVDGLAAELATGLRGALAGLSTLRGEPMDEAVGATQARLYGMR
ncbi:putative metal-dependent hydrolase YjjV [Pseudoclavibacter triregionum]|nr:putative metal-dependent hydrolase YjjV [Pseudoclavibacter triregionum]